MAPVFSGETIVTPPHPTGANVAGAEDADGTPQVIIGVPVFGEADRVAACLAIRFRSEPEVSDLLQASPDSEIDVYAFDSRRLMVSRPRREAVLRRAGLLAEDRIASPRVWVRDPGVSLAEAAAAPEAEAWPPTRMALRALGGSNGVDLESYRDYTGREVLGAWRWLPEYSVGIAAEVGRSDAYAPLAWVKGGFGGATLLLALVADGRPVRRTGWRHPP